VSDTPIFDELVAETGTRPDEPAAADTAPVDADLGGDDQPTDPGGGQ
jgi:hypothetical protein